MHELQDDVDPAELEKVSEDEREPNRDQLVKERNKKKSNESADNI